MEIRQVFTGWDKCSLVYMTVTDRTMKKCTKASRVDPSPRCVFALVSVCARVCLPRQTAAVKLVSNKSCNKNFHIYGSANAAFIH